MRHPSQLQAHIFKSRLDICIGAIENAATHAIAIQHHIFVVDFYNDKRQPRLSASKYNNKVVRAALEEAAHAGYLVNPAVADSPDFTGRVQFQFPQGVMI